MIQLRRLTLSDIPEVLLVQRSAYHEMFHEPSETFANKLSLFPPGARGCFDGGALVAYLFCHPWVAGETVPLGVEHLALPERPTCLYIHDLAVAQSHRGRGLAALLVDEALELAGTMHLPTVALVSVQGSERFWQRLGFVVQHELEYLPGIRARYMIKARS
jgi:GNAT superfamily N-acetyltransferase